MDYKVEYKIQRRIVKALGDYVADSESTLPACKFCGSTDVVRNGHRRGTQYWLCRNCGRGFVANQAVPKGRFPIDTVSSALYNYYAGVCSSSRKVLTKLAHFRFQRHCHEPA